MANDLYTPSMLPKAPRRFKFIIIHDTSCQWNSLQNPYKIDRVMFQSGPMRAKFRNMKNYFEMPYHYVCEKIGQNYQTIVGRPLQYSCLGAYDDIDDLYCKYGIHVLLMGNYNIISHDAKLYQQLCYRIICPMMKTYKINKSRIYLHGELSKDHPDCPGYHFSKQVLYAYMPKYMIGMSGG